MKTKRWIALFLVAVMAFALCACGSKVPPKPEVTDSPAEVTVVADAAGEKADATNAVVAEEAADTADDEAAEADAKTGDKETAADTKGKEITITDMIGRDVVVTPGSYENIVCISVAR